MLVYPCGTPIWRSENKASIWNLLWLSRRMIITTEQTSIYISTFPNTLTSKKSWLYLTVILRGGAGYELIYITNEAVGRVGYYQLISGKSEKNNCLSKFSSSPITGNCHSTHLSPLHKTYSENIIWPVINARSSWRAKTYWMSWQRAERIVRSKNILTSVSSKYLITLSGQKVSQCQLTIVQPDWP